MDKRSIFERGFAILLSVILMAACFPLSIFAEDTTQGPDFSGTNLMNLENVQPSGYTTTTNPYGYDIGEPFLMVEQNELMYLNAWDNKVQQLKRSVGLFGTSCNSSKSRQSSGWYL